MDSKWGIALVAALAGAGLFFTRSKGVVKEAQSRFKNPLVGGHTKKFSPQLKLGMYLDSQLANREYYRQMIEMLPHYGAQKKWPQPVIDALVAKAKRRFEIFDAMAIGAGIIESNGEVRPQYRLLTRQDWKNKDFSESGGPLNPMEGELMGLGSSRIHTQTLLQATNPKTPKEWRAVLRDWESGDMKDRNDPAYQAVLAEDPRIQYHDFDLLSNATQLYFFQFTLPGIVTLQNYGCENPFELAQCLQFMNDFLIYNAFMGGYMESLAITELKALPHWPRDWNVIKTHKELDKTGADLLVFKENPNDPHDIEDVIGFIQVKPYSWVGQSTTFKKGSSSDTTGLDKLIDDSRYFYNPFHRKGKRFDLVFWPEVKKGTAKGGWYETRIPDMRPNAPNPTLTFKYPQIGRKEDNFKRDPNTGQIITEKLPPDKDGFQKTVRIPSKMPARSKGGQMNPSTRNECYLQLLVYEPVKNKRGELETGKFLNLEAVFERLKNNTPDPILDGFYEWIPPTPTRNKQGKWNIYAGGKYIPKADNWWEYIDLHEKDAFRNQ